MTTFDDFLYKAKTVAQFVSLLYMMAALEFTTWNVAPSLHEPLLLIGRILIWVSVALTIISGVRYVWLNRSYLKDDKN